MATSRSRRSLGRSLPFGTQNCSASRLPVAAATTRCFDLRAVHPDCSTYALPTNFTSMITISGTVTGGASAMQAVAERFLETASLDPDAFGSTSEQWVSATIAIPPA